MKITILFLIVAIAVGWTEAQGYGQSSSASSRQQKSGRRVVVVDSASSDSDDSGDDSQDIPVVAAPRVRKPIIRLPPVHGWVKASGGASASSNSNGSDQDQDTSDDSGADDDNSAQLMAAGGRQPKVYVQPVSGSQSGSGRRRPAQVNVAATANQVQGPVGGGPIITGVVYPPIVEGGSPPPQVPGVWDALDQLRGRPAYGVDEIQDLLAAAKPDVDYPIIADIPDQISFSCANVKQAGYYADTDFRCQVFRRCDIDGVETSYLCPNQTLYNQITLVCDWFYNVACANSAKFQDYSNSRLYHSDWLLFDTPPEKDGVDAAQVSAVYTANTGRGKVSGSHHSSSSSSQHHSSSSHTQGGQRAQLEAASVNQPNY